MKRILMTLCGRAGSKGFQNKNLKTFCGYPLVYYSLAAMGLFCDNHPELEVDICLNTDSPDLAALVTQQYPEVTFLPRDAALGGDAVPKMAVFQDSLRRMEEMKGLPYDALFDFDITSPLRTVEDVENLYAKLNQREDIQLVFSVTHPRRNPYFNMVKDCGDHVEKVIASNYTARQQAPTMYDMNASLYAFRRDFLAQNTTGQLWDAKIDVILMKDTAVLDIDSEEDFQMMQLIANYLYQNLPEFAQVRNAIRFPR